MYFKYHSIFLLLKERDNFLYSYQIYTLKRHLMGDNVQ